MSPADYEKLDRRLERIETLLARLLDVKRPREEAVNPNWDPKYFAARVREVGLAQAAAEHNLNHGRRKCP